MKCPDCGDRLEEHEANQLTIDVCVRCRGTLFDRGELEEYKQCSSEGTQASQGTGEGHEVFGVYTALPIAACPRCVEKTLQAGAIGNIDLSRCMSCGGVFIGGSWLRSLKAHSSAEGPLFDPVGIGAEDLFWVVGVMLSD